MPDPNYTITPIKQKRGAQTTYLTSHGYKAEEEYIVIEGW